MNSAALRPDEEHLFVPYRFAGRCWLNLCRFGAAWGRRVWLFLFLLCAWLKENGRPVFSTTRPLIERRERYRCVRTRRRGRPPGFQPTRKLGHAKLERWLRKRKAYNASRLADTAIEAANGQSVRVAGQDVAASTVGRLAHQILNLNTELRELDSSIEERFRRHRHAKVIESMPGFGPLLGAEFLAATGGDVSAFGTADRLAGISGLAPVPRDSGRVSGNLHRPRRYDRRLLRTFYLSAQLSIRHNDQSQVFYNRKRAEGKRHTQAVLALARRRLNVLWAMLRDNAVYQPRPAIAAA